ncbi:bifunctional phosphopantothenoylcysteine decarboxylase/phosphopantothenate--cysteine ligase CoaBC [Niabella beijingensis]|uniref:bifunctional phosphopantothenoylcysteine decarboxylase/phosphopantothenate--cysteine ligase CoaBC n=1 Tax=Niabella beijingensis TaxID=2872700 RepID=UPI001CC12668|nr:bifunctional phosphopantothenoylcysteine decarboxylase/phosphopantothenate--cysteine ligase CoaBC [Niabella beijingensis]MBZ4188394.1 bifunctional phosphopantothenoylcysteine decarboxylase/phosphopantothenate--cysteine ligase CoaBC [Niabella beijingensis]
MLEGKKIAIGISGSISAYKIVHLVRLLIKQKAEVKVIMTPAARDFVAPLTLSTLSKNDVLTDLAAADTWANHVALGRWADLLLIAPLSCNTLAKMAHGHCDNLLLSVYLSATCPVMVSPAMDEDMWQHPATQKNIGTLRTFGHIILAPHHGELASGLIGQGRMEEPEVILSHIEAFFSNTQTALSGKKVLITAGPTQEALDPVRFIGNHSSGKMGYALALECRRRGANVVLVLGPAPAVLQQDLSGMTVIKVTSAEEMYQACMEQFPTADMALMAAAVADYRPAAVSATKIKKQNVDLALQLVKTRDILAALGAIKTPQQLLLGFALETDHEESHALEKLHKKNADYIVLNSLSDGAAFGADTNKITIYSRNGSKVAFDSKSKNAVAQDIINTILKEGETT